MLTCVFHRFTMSLSAPNRRTSCLQHFFLEYDYNDTGSGSGSGSGDLGMDLEEPCNVEHIKTAELLRVFLPVVYALIFTLGITGNGLVVVVLGCQRR